MRNLAYTYLSGRQDFLIATYSILHSHDYDQVTTSARCLFWGPVIFITFTVYQLNLLVSPQPLLYMYIHIEFVLVKFSISFVRIKY